MNNGKLRHTPKGIKVSSKICENLQLSMKRNCHAHGYGGGENIGNWLGVQNPVQSTHRRQEQYDGNKADSLPARAEHEARAAFSHGEEQGGIHRVKSEERHRNAVRPQSRRPDADHFGIVRRELRDNRCRKNRQHQAERRAECRRPQHGDFDRFAQADKIFRTVTVARDGLKAFDESEHGKAAQGNQSGDDAHSGDCRVTVSARSIVRKRNRNARQNLERKRGRANSENPGQRFRSERAVRKAKAEQTFPPQNIRQVHARRNRLRKSRRERRARHAPTERKNEQRVQGNVERSPNQQRAHRRFCRAFARRNAIHRDVEHGENAGRDVYPRIRDGKRHDAFGRPKKFQDRLKERHKSDDDCRPDNQAAVHCGACTSFGTRRVSAPEQPGNDGSCAASKKQPDADDNLPERIRHGKRSRLPLAKSADKIHVGKIVERVHQHADHRRNAHCQKCLRHGRVSEQLHFFVLIVHVNSFSDDIVYYYKI